MKARIILLASSWLAVSVLFAHPAGAATENRMERLAILLDLDSQQKSEVEKILTDAHERHRAAREQARDSGERPTREAKRERHQQLHQETLAKLSTVLNEQQLKKFNLLTEHRHRRHHDH